MRASRRSTRPTGSERLCCARQRPPEAPSILVTSFASTGSVKGTRKAAADGAAQRGWSAQRAEAPSADHPWRHPDDRVRRTMPTQHRRRGCEQATRGATTVPETTPGRSCTTWTRGRLRLPLRRRPDGNAWWTTGPTHLCACRAGLSCCAGLLPEGETDILEGMSDVGNNDGTSAATPTTPPAPLHPPPGLPPLPEDAPVDVTTIPG